MLYIEQGVQFDTNLIEGGVMLAVDYHKMGHKLQFPVLVQPKLDGMRLLYNSKTKIAEARSGKTGKTNSQTDVLNALKLGHWHGLILDGELYKHGKNFQEVMRLINSGGKIEYHIYDVVSDEPFYKRFEKFEEYYDDLPSTVKHLIKKVSCKKVHSHEELMELQQKYLDEGYEGAIVRNPNAPYLHKRTIELQKVKTFQDAEFKVVGYKPHAGGGVVWQCETKKGKTFFAVPTAALHKETGNNVDKFIGKLLTVKFFGYSEDGIPRHPTAKAFRHSHDLGVSSINKKRKMSKRKSVRRSVRRSFRKSPKRSIRKSYTSSKSHGNCEMKLTSKYQHRSSPPFAANECCGSVKEGNDRLMYKSIPNSVGICRWVKH